MSVKNVMACSSLRFIMGAYFNPLGEPVDGDE
jgi:hypothetical protein